MTIDEKAVFARLEQALQSVGDALSRADLDRLLSAEPELGAALEGLALVQPVAFDDDFRVAIDGGRAALLRCRRLGAALLEFTRISLDPAGELGYSRIGMGPGVDRTGAPGTLASSAPSTMEARG
jgi:hypothetical protein